MYSRYISVKLPLCLLLSASACFAPGSVITAEESAVGKIEFNRDVRPILSNHCFTCHGPDSATRESGLRLDQREAAIAEADSGFQAIVPGNVKASELLRRVTANDEDQRMPPPDGPKQLTEKQIAILTKWIEQGAEYQPHWAFLPPKPTALPSVENETWVRNPIDHFVIARLQSEGLKPAEGATRETLIRRGAFD